MGYQEFFASGDAEGGAYQCRVTLADPDGWHWRPGGPSAAQALLQNPFGLPPPLPTPPLPVEVPVPPSSLGLLARLLALLPEAGVAAALATLLPTNSRDDPGYQSEWDLIRRYTPPTDKDRAELADLERRHAEGTLTAEEEAHLLALLARVKGLYLASLSDADFNKEWDRTAPPELAQLDLQSTLDHVESRDSKGARADGISGAHNKLAWEMYQTDYVEVSHIPHPTIPGVELVTYQIHAINRAGNRTGQLKAKVYPKTLYDPQVWPRPRLERALKHALHDAYVTNGSKFPLPREWEGRTEEGYLIHGFNDPQDQKITSFFFKP